MTPGQVSGPEAPPPPSRAGLDLFRAYVAETTDCSPAPGTREARAELWGLTVLMALILAVGSIVIVAGLVQRDAVPGVRLYGP